MFTNLAKQMNNLIHVVLAERYLFFIERESSPTLTLERSFSLVLTSGMNIIQNVQDKSFYT